MDTILKALERAKADKSSSDDLVTSTRKSSTGTINDVEKNVVSYTKTRVIKTDPRELRNKRVISGFEPGPVLDAYRLLRTQVLQRMREHDWNVLAIISPTEQPGKNLTAINLAISLAMEVNQTVLLADLDLRQPDLHNYFGYQPEAGISDYLKNGTPLDEILFNPSIERLVVLPGREAMQNSSETLSSPFMINLVGELKDRYPGRLVIFNLPPILSTDDALAFSPYVDAALLVIEEGDTTTDELELVLATLQPVNIIGTVLNKGKS